MFMREFIRFQSFEDQLLRKVDIKSNSAVIYFTCMRLRKDLSLLRTLTVTLTF